MLRPTTDMSDKHEQHIQKLFGGALSPGSGNRDNKPLDVRHDPAKVHYAFGFDGKSTLGKSASVSLAMWDKLVDQAHGLMPALPLRFYANNNLSVVTRDLVVVDLNDLFSIWEDAEKYQDLANS